MIKFRFLMIVVQGSRRANEMLRRHRRPVRPSPSPGALLRGWAAAGVGRVPGLQGKPWEGRFSLRKHSGGFLS